MQGKRTLQVKRRHRRVGLQGLGDRRRTAFADSVACSVEGREKAVGRDATPPQMHAGSSPEATTAPCLRSGSPGLLLRPFGRIANGLPSAVAGLAALATPRGRRGPHMEITVLASATLNRTVAVFFRLHCCSQT